MIGEEYAYCYSCPTNPANPTCDLVKTYEYNQTVISQCTTADLSDRWMVSPYLFSYVGLPDTNNSNS